MEEDEALVQRIRGGDTAAFDALYRRYGRRLFSYIRRHVRDLHQAEDLYQEVFLSVLRDRGFDLQRGGFGGWLFTVARNACLTHLRDAGRREAKHEALEREPPRPASSTPEEELARRQQAHAFRSALSNLPAPQQEVLLLKQLGELTYQQIGQVLGIPEGTVKSRVHQAVRGLQRRLASEGGPP
jgi:RNA polymerase sigma-70 factor (ECF subfamily)